jgi:hypothetical protein
VLMRLGRKVAIEDFDGSVEASFNKVASEAE